MWYNSIGGIFMDLLCDDYQHAARNRLMVASHQNIAGYVEVEDALKLLPLSAPLPSWIQQGRLPQGILVTVDRDRDSDSEDDADDVV